MLQKISILTNLPSRDKSTDEYLGEELRDLGYEVNVTDFLPKNREHILIYKPDLVVLPEPRCEYTVDFIETIRAWGIKVVVKRCEGGTAREAWDLMEESERKTVMGTWPYYCDLEIVWSKDFANLVAEHGHTPKEKLFVAGALPFDPYFYNKYPQPSPNRKILLFAPGWGHADRSRNYNVPEADPGSPIHSDAFDRHNEGRTKWIKMIREVGKVLEKEGWATFIRPKVGEIPRAYQDAVGKYCRLAPPSITENALWNTDVLIHAGSTMAIEAHLCGIPAFSYCGEINQVKGYQFPKVSPELETIDEIIDAVRTVQLYRSNANDKAIRKLEQDFYGTIDGHACKRAAKAISMIPLGKLKVPFAWPPPKLDGAYYIPNVWRFIMQWQCECCKNTSFSPPGAIESGSGVISVASSATMEAGNAEMIKCPWCGIALARRYPDEYIIKKGPPVIPDRLLLVQGGV